MQKEKKNLEKWKKSQKRRKIQTKLEKSEKDKDIIVRLEDSDSGMNWKSVVICDFQKISGHVQF